MEELDRSKLTWQDTVQRRHNGGDVNYVNYGIMKEMEKMRQLGPPAQ